MPRRRAQPAAGEVTLEDAQTGDILRLLTTPQTAAPLALPASRPHRHAEEGKVDAYAALAGAVADPHRTPRRGRRAASSTDAEVAAARYDAYIDTLVSVDGDTDAALAIVFGIELADAKTRRVELLTLIRAGAATTSTAALLERNDLTLAARIGIYRKHAYSPFAAASLKALDAIENLDGSGPDEGSDYDSYVRSVMSGR